MAIDVLVTDLNLPGASGIELAKEARNLRPSTLVVYATGDPSAVRGERGATVVAKPYDAIKLAEAIATAASDKRSEVKVAGKNNDQAQEV